MPRYERKRSSDFDLVKWFTQLVRGGATRPVPEYESLDVAPALDELTCHFQFVKVALFPRATLPPQAHVVPTRVSKAEIFSLCFRASAHTLHATPPFALDDTVKTIP